MDQGAHAMAPQFALGLGLAVRIGIDAPLDPATPTRMSER
jgi:hypothetical protein